MNEIKKINNKKYKYILSDIFDTIVFRTVQPEYVKKMWSNQLVKRFELNMNMIDIYNKRNQVETKLGEDNFNNGLDWEFRYSDMLKEMYDYLNLKIDYETFEDIATDIEITIESMVQFPDENVINAFKQAKKEGKKVYCVSDMYLSKEMIKKIFTNLNIIDLFDDIFVSCEYYQNKKTGHLYDIVMNEINANPSDCVMMGDNYSSDYENSIQKQIDAIHLNRNDQYKKYEEFLEEHNEKKLMEKFIKLSKTSRDNFEHSIFSLYKFIEKLYYKLLNDNLDEVFFLSREGEYLKKLFDAYNETIYGKKIKSHYILVSRKATYLPSLKKLEEEDFSKLLNQYSYISLNEFLGSLNFTKDECNEILKSFQEECKTLVKKEKITSIEIKEMSKGNFDIKISCLYNSNILKLLKENKVFKKIYDTLRKEQNSLFKKYIKQLSNNKKICVVDVGWNGSIQDNIQNILGSEYEVTGYLYGLVSRDVNNVKNKEGLIFSNVPEQGANFDLFFENRTIFEILLGASHGSANRYIEKDGKVEATTFEKEEEHKMYVETVSIIQDKMMKIYKELLSVLPNGYYNNLSLDKKINKLHFDMVFRPTKEQLKFFNRIYHYENFGVFEFSKFNLKSKLNFTRYLKENVKYFVRNKSFFYDTFWPTLKLNNEKLYIQKILYVNNKFLKLKRKDVL